MRIIIFNFNHHLAASCFVHLRLYCMRLVSRTLTFLQTKINTCHSQVQDEAASRMWLSYPFYSQNYRTLWLGKVSIKTLINSVSYLKHVLLQIFGLIGIFWFFYVLDGYNLLMQEPETTTVASSSISLNVNLIQNGDGNGTSSSNSTISQCRSFAFCLNNASRSLLKTIVFLLRDHKHYQW